MLQRSKIIRSRDEWKLKAVQRAEEIREHRKTQRRHLQRIAQLQSKIRALEQTAEVKKSALVPAASGNLVDLAEAQQVRTLCVLLVLQAVVSFRSVPRILALFRTEARLGIDWVPHFTSVINWTLRIGLGLLRQVAPIDAPWVAIIDHSIDVGTKKALVVLRVPLAALSQRGAAIQLGDCECVGLTIAETVNGETVARQLEEIFQRSGTPAAITKDCDATLHKGVRLWMERAHVSVPVIEDIGHVLAAALKAQFEQTGDYQRFTSLAAAAKAAKALRQTELAFLIPPKLRSKGRFLSIGKLARWGEKMLDVLAVKGRARKGSPLAKLRAALPGFLTLRPFVATFAATAVTVSQVMEILKHKGLHRSTYEQCCQLAEQLPAHSIVKHRLRTWLSRHIDIQRQLSVPLMVSSDIIESLFGNFKHLLERSPQADMNRTVLLIPALCGRPDAATLSNALVHARHGDLATWEQEHIPYTMRKKRQTFFADNQSQKAGNS